MYASMLKMGVINKDLGILIANSKLKLNITLQQKWWPLMQKSHFVIIAYVKGIGLVGIVSFFKPNAESLLLQILILSIDVNFNNITPKLWINTYEPKKLYFIDYNITVTGRMDLF